MWVLSLFIFGGYYGSTPTTFVQEYSSYDRCQSAYKINATELSKKDLMSMTVIGTCTQK